MQNIFNFLALVPSLARKYIIFYNGIEFTRHTLLKHGMKMDTFFCNPSSPWQKAQVKKTNAMLHRYIPKNNSLEAILVAELGVIKDKLNNTPRKILKYKTPAEIFTQEINRVALRT